MSFVTGEFVDPSRTEDSAYEDSSYYCPGRVNSIDGLVVLGTIKSIPDVKSGHNVDALDVMVVPSDGLSDEELAKSVPATKFVGEDGHLVLPDTPAAFLLHLGAEVA